MSEEYLSEINYDKLIEKSLKNVVVEALRIAERQGLPGENHFYITFKTNHPQTKISAQLKSQYPEEMTIVIQHQYSNLYVEGDHFSVDLSFGGVLQTLSIPFAAITYFGDPSVRFGISFGSEIDSNLEEEVTDSSSKSADIVSIDAFRKKGND